MRPRPTLPLGLSLLLASALGFSLGACSKDDDGGAGGGGAGPGGCTTEGQAEYCYPGSAAERGIGECRDGSHVCVDGAWTECVGYVLPTDEVCDDLLDNDCNGVADEGCPCESGSTKSCYHGPTSSIGMGICVAGTQACTGGVWSEQCEGEVLPADDEPCNEVDDNCNGIVDDGCSCTTGNTRACYTAAVVTRGVGPCHDGTQSCVDGQWQTTCPGEVTPTPEICNSADDDCDSAVDEELGTTTCGTGPCQQTVQNCVAGTPQTCTPLCDDVNCTSGGQCSTGFCKDGRCCNTACTEDCRRCTSGTCTTVTNGYDDPECTGSYICDGSGVCKKKTGETCSSGGECQLGICRDGRCCNTACSSACQSCASGACAAVANADDADTCTGANTCDASAACKKKTGQTCSAGGECVLGMCVDSHCCNSACNGTCQSCASGSCAAVTNADDPDSCNSTTSTCSASGTCLLKNGQYCTYATDCASNYCYCDKYVCYCA